MTDKLDILKNAYQNKDISAEVVYFIDKELLVPSTFLSKMFRVTSRTIQGWESKGFSPSTHSLPRLKLFNIDELKRWKKINISEKQAKGGNSGKGISPELTSFIPDGVDEYKDIPEHLLPKLELERRNEVEKLNKAKLSNDKLRGDLISIDDIDKDMATLATMFMSMLINFEKSAPVVLENLKKEEITPILEESHTEMLEKLDLLINKEFEGDDTLYDIIDIVNKQLIEGRSAKDIKKCLE